MPNSNRAIDGPGPIARAALEPLAHASLLAAGVAGTMVAVVEAALGLPVDPATIALATCGTLVVYNIDHLRDIERDALLAPRRSAFVARHRRALVGLVAFSAAGSAASAAFVDPVAWGVCACVLALGLLHRRLKRVRGIKTLYLTVSWLAVVLGLPLAGIERGAWPPLDRLYWVVSIVGCSIVANLMASNLDRRRATEDPAHVSRRRRLNSAIAVAGLGLGFAVVAPDALRGLAAIPFAEFVATVRYRDDELYVPVVIDGALLVGASVGIALLVLPG